MVGLVCQNVAIALLGLAEPHLVFVEDAQVDPRRQRHRRPVRAPPVVFERQVVVAVKIVDIGQLEERPVVVLVELERLLELGGSFDHLARGRKQAALLEVVFRRRFALLGQPGQDLPGFIFLARAAQRPARCSSEFLGS